MKTTQPMFAVENNNLAEIVSEFIVVLGGKDPARDESSFIGMCWLL